MARFFSSDEALKVIREGQILLRLLRDAVFGQDFPREGVITAKNAIASQNILKILKDVSVDELANEKSGFKIKPLHDAGFHSYADLHQASLQDLIAVQGISPEGASNIKAVLNRFIQNASSRVRIRLNFDHQDLQSGALVQALSVYRKTKPQFEICQQLLTRQEELSRCIRDLQPGTSTLKWIFTSREKKEKATAAYQLMNGLLNGDYSRQAYQAAAALEAADKTTVQQAWDEFLANPIDFYNALEEICPGATGELDSIYGLTADLAKAIEGVSTSLEGFKSTLRRYQEWGVKYILHQGKVLLGDEMGLGKTIQAIAAMITLRNRGMSHFIVVCPASVVTNWCREIAFHSDFIPVKIHGSKKVQEFERWRIQGGVAVTTFDSISSLPLTADYKFDMLVVDEAQYVKNPATRRSKNIRLLCEGTERVLFMTGTALENHVGEMLELMEILNPFVALEAKKVAAMVRAPEFMGVIAPVYYRRKREDVLSELPELIESEEWCDLGEEEVEAYENSVMTRNMAALRRVSFNIDHMENSSKMQRLLEIVEDAKAENRKVIVFSYFLDTINKVRALLGDTCVGPINGSVSPRERQEMVDLFNQAPAGTVLVSQILAGGVGLNIQAASVVILCEPQFKPSLENQAISRAYRMGQARSVLVYRLLAQGTIDEYMMALLNHKQKVFDAFADKSVAAAVTEDAEIDETTFKNLVEEEIKRLKARKEGNRDLLGYKAEDKVRITQELLDSTFALYNRVYFEDALPKVKLYGDDHMGNRLGEFSLMDSSIHIAKGEWRYQSYRNTMVHEMCHLFVFTTAAPTCMGAGDGHGKDWLEIVNRLNSEHPELDITLYADHMSP